MSRPDPSWVYVKVKFTCGAYVTNRVGRHSSSSTESAQRAVLKQAEKLFPGKALAVEMVSFDGGNSTWKAGVL